ncbi:c-type cytochrome [Candidatus Methylocalor cossyra]|uniref:Cytochrome C oxidase, cbb3-type, subunit III n=1 Tax=Candidatus Methylocalor cossyra TaxID=3108543 RepID=A0ABM9NGC6_9GAMM
MTTKKFLNAVLLAVGVSLVNAAFAEEPKELGEKIYKRAFGRGCGTCHDVQPNPNLFESVNKLSREDFKTVLINGRNTMPKAMDTIMALPVVKNANLTQDQAVDALIAYLKSGKKD